MADDSRRIEEHELTATFARFGAGVLPVLNAALSIAAIAYVVGWWQAKTYYQHFSAVWIVSLLSSTDLLAWSVGPFAIIFTVFALVLAPLARRPDHEQANEQYFWCSAIAVGVGTIGGFLVPARFGVLLALLVSVSWVSVAATLLHRWAVRATLSSVRVDLGVIAGVFFVGYMVFWNGQSAVAVAEATRDKSPATSMLQCARGAWLQREWRLLAATPERAMLVSLVDGDAAPVVRAVAWTEVDEIGPCASSATPPEPAEGVQP